MTDAKTWVGVCLIRKLGFLLAIFGLTHWTCSLHVLLPCIAAEPKLPNIIFILADDLGWSDTTLFGTTALYETPNVERLARRGMTFTRAYSASPLCSPTRSAILTGLSPARTGLTSPNCHLPEVVLEATRGTSASAAKKSIQPTPVTRLKTEYRTLAESLKDLGYTTGHFGKWHLGSEPYSPLQQGFDVDVPHHPGPGPAGSYVAPWKFKDFDHDPDIPDQHIEDRMAEEAVAWMEEHRGEPFFLNYWMFSVHAPFDAKKTLIEKYRSRVRPDQAQRSPTYAAMIESMDDAIGTLLDALERLRIADNTIIIFTSDNGGNMYNEIDDTTPTSNAPLRGGKATVFEGGTRVPCVIVWPGVVAANSRSDALVQSEDFYPTLLDGLGVSPEPQQQFDGVSILPALKSRELDRTHVFQYFPHEPGVPDWLPPSATVHRGDWKLIRIFHGGQEGQHRHLLFHLKEDPGEQRDLVASHPEEVRELDTLIEEFLTSTRAVVPVANPDFDVSKYRPEEEGKAKPRKPSSEKKPTGQSDPGAYPQLKGWKARGCTATFADGVATITANAQSPFLGVAAGKLTSQTKMRFRLQCAPGQGTIEWRPGGNSGDSRQATKVAFEVETDRWTEIAVDVPSQAGESGVLRLYLPAVRNSEQRSPEQSSGDPEQVVRIDWIEVKTENQTKLWDF